MTDIGSRWQKWVVCLLLGAAVLAAFWPALKCNFVTYDDVDYVTTNPVVQQGLTWAGLKWAFTTTRAANWHPLTWVSHMADCQVYGLKPAGHHFTSLLLHAVNAILLFLLLQHMTGVLWPSAWVAVMFALHPLRVESVVWVAERKDVLSTFFWMLTVGAYIRYAKIVNCQLSIVNYYSALVFFALGLMAKPMLVTLPFVLLLLDYWPLGRLKFGPNFSWRLLVEKVPFLVLAAADSLATFLIQRHSGSVATLSRFPLDVRLANVPFAYVTYIRKNFWPTGLAVFYPHRALGVLEVGGSVCLLGAISVWVLRRWQGQPFLVVGWFWFLGMLLPTIGLVQVGYQAMADRYSYLPSVGLWIMVAWGVRDWIAGRALPRMLAAVAGGLAVIACMELVPQQTLYWRTSRDLFQRAVDTSSQNYLACYNLGCNTMAKGQYDEAIVHFNEAVSTEKDDTLWADHSRAYNDLGYCYLHEGQITNAVANFEKALNIKPKFPEAYFNMGRAFLTNNQPDVAVDCFQRALALEQNPVILGALATAYARMGQFPKAVATAQRARQLALAQKNLALAQALNSQLQMYQTGGGGSPP